MPRHPIRNIENRYRDCLCAKESILAQHSIYICKIKKTCCPICRKDSQKHELMQQKDPIPFPLGAKCSCARLSLMIWFRNHIFLEKDLLVLHQSISVELAWPILLFPVYLARFQRKKGWTEGKKTQNLYLREALAPKEGIKEPLNMAPQKHKVWNNAAAENSLKCTTRATFFCR